MFSFKTLFSPVLLIIYAFFLGILTSYSGISLLIILASEVSKIFINLLMLISLPLIFLSIVSTISGMQSFEEMKQLGKITLKYTLSTTIVEAFIAFVLFRLINPVRGVVAAAPQVARGGIGDFSFYFSFIAKIIPSNIIEPFSSNANIASTVFLALMISLAILSLPIENKKILHSFFSSLFAAVLKVTNFIILIIPLGVWAFTTVVIGDFRAKTAGISIKGLFLYVLCVLLAEFIHGFVILPLFLLFKKISPLKIFRGMAESVMIAFFSRSSTVALPISLRNAEKKLGISKRVANFVFPLCTTVNMNGAAIFIFVTVLFVAMSNGISFSMLDMFLWVFIATFAAVGNAGVAMGSYFLSSAFLAALGVPLHVLGIILALNTVLDMFETGLNIWSDGCVAAVVEKEL
jgi:Na+/H+-dicarboxylate symporter